MAKIYLGTKSGKYDCNISGSIKSTITVTTTCLKECINIHKVSYQIRYDSEFYDLGESYFRLYIFTGKHRNPRRYPIFTCYNTAINNIFDKIEIYYAVFSPDTPFLITFISQYTYYHLNFEKLKSISSDYYYNLKTEFKSHIIGLVQQEYNSIYSKLTIMFYVGSDGNTNVKQSVTIIKDENNEKSVNHSKINKQGFKKAIFTRDIVGEKRSSRKGFYILNNGNMFLKNKPGSNKILQETVQEFTDRSYYGIIIYYTSDNKEQQTNSRLTHSLENKDDQMDRSNDVVDNTALLIELIKGCTKIQFKRTSKSPNNWEKVNKPIIYNNDVELANELEKIKSDLYDNIIYYIDYKIHSSTDRNIYDFYNNSVVISCIDKKDYVIYTHTANNHYKDKKAEVMYKYSKFETLSRDNELENLNISDINVYYRSKEPNDESINPILLVKFTEKSTSKEGKKHYYRRTSNDGSDWSLLTENTIIDLYSQIYGIDKTENLKGCLSGLYELNSFDGPEISYEELLKIIEEENILISLLQQIEINLFYHIIILLNKHSQYTNTEIESEIAKTNPYFVNSDKQPDLITVDKCLLHEHICFKHKITLTDNSVTNMAIIPYINGTKIITQNKKGAPSLLIYGASGVNCHTISDSESNNKDEICIFFQKNDNIPLMLCYCNTLYAPISKGEFHKWKEVETPIGSSDSTILEQLKKIKDELNLIDISATDILYNLPDKYGNQRSNTFDVHIIEEHYNICDLFGYYRHKYKGKPEFNLSLLILIIKNEFNPYIDTKTINVHLEKIPNVCYIDVYFSFFNKTNLLIVGIKEKDTISYYRYHDFINKSKDKFWLKEINKITLNSNGNSLIDHLINEHNSRNHTVTYRLNKNTNSNRNVMYNNNSINLTLDKSQQTTYQYITHTHKQINEKSKVSNILYNDKKIKIKETLHIDIENLKTDNLQNFKINEAITYSLSNHDKEHLLIKLKNDTHVYYLRRFQWDDTLWKQLELNYLKQSGIDLGSQKNGNIGQQIETILKKPNNIERLLRYINYFFKKSIILELDKGSEISNRVDMTYEMKVIENNLQPEKNEYIQNSYHVSRPINPKNTKITLKKEKKCKLFDQSNFKLFIHDISHSKQSTDYKDIVGLRLFLSITDKEIQLYDNINNHENRVYLYFIKNRPRDNSNYNIYVYLDGNTPILVFYKGKGYCPLSKENFQENKWFLFNKIKSSECNEAFNVELLNQLRIISSHLETKNEVGHNSLEPSTITAGTGDSDNSHVDSPQTLPEHDTSKDNSNQEKTTLEKIGDFFVNHWEPFSAGSGGVATVGIGGYIIYIITK